MAKFKYKFEGLLNLREKLEDAKQREYADSLMKLREKEEIKSKVKKSLDYNMLMLKQVTSSELDPREIAMHQQYNKVLKKHMIVVTKDVKNAKKESESKRVELLEAMKSKKTLAILKDKQYEQFLDEEKKMDQQMIDQIVSFSYSND